MAATPVVRINVGLMNDVLCSALADCPALICACMPDFSAKSNSRTKVPPKAVREKSGCRRHHENTGLTRPGHPPISERAKPEVPMSRTRLILIALIAASTLAACETAKGVGRDITRAADAVDRAI